MKETTTPEILVLLPSSAEGCNNNNTHDLKQLDLVVDNNEKIPPKKSEGDCYSENDTSPT